MAYWLAWENLAQPEILYTWKSSLHGTWGTSSATGKVCRSGS